MCWFCYVSPSPHRLLKDSLQSSYMLYTESLKTSGKTPYGLFRLNEALYTSTFGGCWRSHKHMRYKERS